MPIVQFFGAIFLLIGLGVGARGVWRWRCWQHGTGEVIDYAIAAGSEYDDYFPRIRVRDQTGKCIEFVSAIGGTGKPWAVGENVNVIYRIKGEKVEGEVVSRFFQWVFPACCLLVGILMLLARFQPGGA